MSQESHKSGPAAPGRPPTDVVGLEIGAGHPEGVPAVRLRLRANRKTELVAAGFLPLTDRLPETAAAAEPVIWTLPKPFQAPYAALAVSSSLASLRHAGGAGDERADCRTASLTFGADIPPLTASLPEFQAAWAARLLPEGRAPTACSLQVASAAAVNGFSLSPHFATLTETTVVLFVFANHTALAAFSGGKLALYREHPLGFRLVRAAISRAMHIEDNLVDAVIQEALVDATPIIEPVLKPLFRQVEMLADYLLRRRNCTTLRFSLCGLPAGMRLWGDLFTRALNYPLTPFHPFDGLLKAQRPGPLPADIAAAEPFLMTALGAARAVLEAP